MSHNCHVKNTAEVRRGCQMSIGEADCRIGMQEAVGSSGQRARRNNTVTVKEKRLPERNWF